MAATKVRAVEDMVRHLDDCPAERIETYEVRNGFGTHEITRCIDCGAQHVQKTTEVA